MNKYHLSLHLQFKQDVDVNKIEKELNLVAFKKSLLKDSKGTNKTAKLWFKTPDITDDNTFDVIEKFVENLKDTFYKIGEFNKLYDGFTTFTLAYEDFKNKPFIKLSPKTMKILADNNISFDVEFFI